MTDKELLTKTAKDLFPVFLGAMIYYIFFA